MAAPLLPVAQKQGKQGSLALCAGLLLPLRLLPLCPQRPSKGPLLMRWATFAFAPLLLTAQPLLLATGRKAQKTKGKRRKEKVRPFCPCARSAPAGLGYCPTLLMLGRLLGIRPAFAFGYSARRARQKAKGKEKVRPFCLCVATVKSKGRHKLRCYSQKQRKA
jgi:hypothetical protein